ncbi:hypothetical protein BGW36DRAFT_389094 [Talaromyces proteolyticus]|uniref:BZIP domain-containing protein n=1 Tax=Talaromyces proteolyticus TaxID=1131652 RepID=A0AAD4KGL4_9EURO|nr:uncharacterized protein BGW36DRAFT_389094 [Talaromyces proteolyticus]KAH8690633.1 hypothetical protein BGW36DRAFT_389094 [Talaromyces proteolyticus]
METTNNLKLPHVVERQQQLDTRRIQKRRHQIKEAQRTYRSRQKSQINELKARVAYLEDVVNQVGQHMDTFSAHLVSDGILISQSKMLQYFSILQEKVTLQLKKAEIHTIETHSRPVPAFAQSQQFQEKITAENLESHTKESADIIPKLKPTANFWHINALLPPIESSNQSGDYCFPPNGIIRPLNPSFEPINYITTPFTRKLFVACGQGGHQWLTNSSVTEEALWPHFGLLLQYLPRQEIVSYLEHVLQLNAANPIKDDRFPFVSIGGAGTHFASTTRCGIDTRQICRKTNGWVELSSEEEWFDIHDVEGFLDANSVQFDGGDRSFHSGQELLGFADGIVQRHSLMPGQSDPENTVIAIDQSILINGLVQCGICIGCAPAFRRRDVENLVWKNIKRALH